MSPDKQRIAIAEVCGIEIPNWVKARGETEWWVNEIGGEWRELPDYPNDLNAIHEAVLGYLNPRPPREKDVYLNLLSDAAKTSRQDITMDLVHATAAQRCEAFLRTIGKWDDSK